MSTPTSDSPETNTIDMSQVKETTTEVTEPVVDLTTSEQWKSLCSLCNRPLEHCDVTIIGTNKKDENIVFHPHCLREGSDIKAMNQIYVHVEKGQRISSAKKLIIQKRYRAIIRNVQKANAIKQQQEAKL